ncbi:MAG TPA: glycosyltransferase [Ktedonobacterales bacterium]|nr:glycosyltransferase [Ktedonobacterales bacterium]
MKGATRPRTVLFLISDTGAGHRSAANAIHHAMRLVEQQLAASQRSAGDLTRAPRPGAHDPNWRVVLVDVFAECGRFPLSKGVFLYGPAITYSPRLYSQLFRMTNSVNRFNAAWRLSQPFIRQGLTQLIERTRPDVIVSVHPLLNHITLQVLRDLDLRIPFLTVITDLFSIHCSWIAPGVTACITPTEEVRQFAINGGVSPRRVRLLGMPIDPKFAMPPTNTLAERKTALGLDPALPVVLLVGGGDGAGGLARAAAALSSERLNAQLVIVTGRNKQLYGELQRQRANFLMPTQVLGFVSNMPELMRAADVIITKAGPGTLSEAMACELPIILTGAVPGQEEGNVNFVIENNMGLLATTPNRIVTALRSLLDPTNPQLAQMRDNVRRLSKPRASFDIARLILSYVPPAGAPSLWESARRPTRGRLTRALLSRRRWAIRSTRRLMRGRGSGAREARLLRIRIPGWGRTHGQARRAPGVRSLAGARALLLRGTSFGKVQLWRPGRDRGRDDARTFLGGGGDPT